MIDHKVDDQTVSNSDTPGGKSVPMTIFWIKVDLKTVIHSMAAIVCRT